MTQSGSDQSFTPLVLLAGQSNMEGAGENRKLPKHLRTVQERVRIYTPNRGRDHEPLDNSGRWVPLTPGHGIDVRQGNDNVHLSERFGVELSFAQRIRCSSGIRGLALFKYAKGGSSLHPEAPDDWGSWDVEMANSGELNQWSRFRHHYRLAVQHWKVNCEEEFGKLKPAGMVWLQGESDATYSREIAEGYDRRLERLIAAVRDMTDRSDLPVLIGAVSTKGVENSRPALPQAEIILEQQKETARRDPMVRFVELPVDHTLSDPWHYDSRTCIEVGTRLGTEAERLFF